MKPNPVKQYYKKYMSSRHLKEAIWVGFGQGVSLLASILTIKLLTNIVSPEVYGYSNLLIVALILPNWLFLSPISQSTLRYYAGYKEQGKLKDLVSTATIAYIWLTLSVTLVFNAIISFGYIEHAGIDARSLHITSILFLIEAWISLGTSLASASRDRYRVSMTTTFSAIGRPLCIFFAIRIAGDTLLAVMMGYLAASLLVIWYALRPLIQIMGKPENARPSRLIIKKMLRYGLPFGAWSLFAWMQQYVDRYVVESILGAATLGLYVVALQTSSLPFTILGGILAQFMTPIVYQKAGTGDEHARIASVSRLIIKICVGVGVVGLFIVCIYAFIGKHLMQFMTNKTYEAPSSILVILALSMLISTIAQQLSLILLANNRAGQLLIVKVLPGLVSLPILWILVRSYSLHGAAFASLIVSCMYFSLIVIILRRYNRFEPVHD